MKSLFFSWLVFQMLVGIWLFISPFVYGFGETSVATSNMIFGPIVVLLGIGSIFYELYHKEGFGKEKLHSPSSMEHTQKA